MTARRSALGRGLGALISSPKTTDDEQRSPAPPTGAGAAPSRPATTAGATPIPEIESATRTGSQSLLVSSIDANPEQPRRRFDSAHLQQLAQSILRHGVLQPVVVRRAGDRYQLVVGERRWRAARAAGLKEIPAVIADVDPAEQLEIAIVENVQRHDLNPMELAHAYMALVEAGHTQEEIGKKVAMDRSSVANHLRLLELSRDLQEDVETGRLSMGHAKALLQIPSPERRRHIRAKIIKEGLSVRASEQLGRQIAGPSARRRAAPAGAAAAHDPDTQRLLETLQQRFQARISLAGDLKKGKIEIEYFGSEDLSRITSLLLGER